MMANAALTAAPTEVRGRRRSRTSAPTAYLWLLPGVALAAFVVGYPIVTNIGSSFTDDSTGGVTFVGLANYAQVLGDPHFIQSLWLTVVWTIGVTIMQFVIGFLAAVMANTAGRYVKILRPILILPWALPGVVAAFIWVFFYNENGLVNQLLGLVGIHTETAWLASSNTAFGAVMIAAAWKGFPFYFLMMLAGLQAVPQEIREAARIDGASPIKELFYVVIPQMRAAIITSLALGLIATSNYFDGIYLMTGGGPTQSTETLPVWIYNVAFQQFNIPKASALSVIILLVVVVFMIVQTAVSRGAARKGSL